ncbi:hypothetical protein FJV41_27380 [Myxococcus llanfairpwllgwyngyllgogerychwyrndrobwllllantysiliogogogochensis]|uniref:Glycosyltransferase RgtA/B/C/D-like domain-containing protein n=1 Tax=Myxococcus llanfairpwllgwyngyllgogerychwyrndrobwllllantysiliogogogochensis TaxID=2590453 RepID=A0A540WUQ7_9BACT|nr:hypothetical protein [Myxococcus llanfairpwllgwyngyllgogerychwyrndrobwllllantysiliogogogochensis]TQF12748.1 hypothetical protein FJV41_27380 [Myxococcus llanfairpwllgwyngyllgogerychwyrndrobwllllantysiliogogogochensis]
MVVRSEAGPTDSTRQGRRLPPGMGQVLLALLAGGIVFGGMRLTWPSGPFPRFERHVLQTSDMVLALVVAVGTFMVAWSFSQGARREDPVSVRHRWRLFLGLWALFALPLLLWWVGEWPGHLHSDARQSLLISSLLRVEPWLSTLWSIWVQGIHRATGQFPFLSLFCVVGLAALLADFFSLLLHLGLSRRLGGVFIALVATSIPVAVLVTNLSHDALNALLRLGIALILLRVLSRKVLTGQSGVTPVTLPSLALLTGVATLLRGDSLVLFLYVPAVLLLSRQVRIGAAVVLLLVPVAINQVFRRVIEPRLILNGPELAERYAVSLLLNPLGFMVVNKYVTATPEEDQATIEAVVTYSCLRDRYILEESPCYWSDLRAPITPEKIVRLRALVLRMARDNPALMLSNRLITFAGTLGLSPRASFPVMDFRETVRPEDLYSPNGAELLRRYGLEHSKAPQALARVTHWLRDASLPYEHGRWLYFPWNGLPALLLTLWLVSRWRTLPVSAMVAGAILAPAGLVFIAAPASHPSYVTDLWVFGYLAVPLAWFEARVLRAKAASRASAAGEGGSAGAVDVAPAHLSHHG